MQSAEAKIVFVDGGKTRVIRGLVKKEGDFYIVRRRDGKLTLNKNCVLKIEEWNSKSEGVEGDISDGKS